MKIILPLVVWLTWTTSHVATQSQHGIGLGIKREVFFLNLEDGYFGCQVNDSTEVLQLYELSKLCDGVQDCYKGSDELRKELKCTNDCTKEDGTECTNGVCLNGVCHCNDGFGGCNCQEHDVNECKSRPCDVFAHCTNTVGSFQCTCFPGYIGNGFKCEDINECQDPAIRSRCVQNAECCNLPAHFICKCNQGFEGDGEVQCRDIDECLHPDACGQYAVCTNLPGNYTCSCPDGFTGNPYDACVDVNECELGYGCGPGAICTNEIGNRRCECPVGYQGDPYETGCVDVNECIQRDICGRGALCSNTPGSYKCSCPPGFRGDPAFGCTDVDCISHNDCGIQQACIKGRCQNPCTVASPCASQQDCQVKDHQPICIKVCQCQSSIDCYKNFKCDGCKCVPDSDQQPIITEGCDHCPPGITCDPFSGACMKEPPGPPKSSNPCESDSDCIETEACYKGQCAFPCDFANVCGIDAKCHAKMHRPICTCPKDYDGNPGVKCSPTKKLRCNKSEDCQLTEACINYACQRPCNIHNPCAQNAVCINTNHGSDCSCAEGYQGNGYVGCVPVMNHQPVCQYNEDCPPELLCDRLNRICISPCQEDSCGENAECLPVNHGIECKCFAGYSGNPYVLCSLVQGCRSDSECLSTEACINSKCANPCRCGLYAICDVYDHKALCKCLPGYSGNPNLGCLKPENPCIPSPCGINAMCEAYDGNPICFCPKGLTGNPFKNCIPEGDECSPNPCGPNSGCRLNNNKATCFCLPEYEGIPPQTPCQLPSNPCDPSPCGPNTQCSLLSNGFAKCTCLPGYLESPNTIKGCVEVENPCVPNPCGVGASCDPTRSPVCFCREPTQGNPYKNCVEPIEKEYLCQPGRCGQNADCYVTENRERCFCKYGFIGDPYVGCKLQPSNPCIPNPCGNNAICKLDELGQARCACAEGTTGNPAEPDGCKNYECRTDSDCSYDKACLGYRCCDPCPGACGLNTVCQVEKHHPVCSCIHDHIGNPIVKCYQKPVEKNPCNPSPCGLNTICYVSNQRAVCSCVPYFFGNPETSCRAECLINSDCPSDKACLDRKCINPCSDASLCGINALCQVYDHTAACICPEDYIGDPLFICVKNPIISPIQNTTYPCSPSPCNHDTICSVYGNHVAICDECASDAINPNCNPECLLNSDCPFDKACIRSRCIDPCPGSCGINAICETYYHNPICACPQGYIGNPFDYCSIPTTYPHDYGITCGNVPCGVNTECREKSGVLSCTCLPGFFGDALIGCRPECILNSDCPFIKACINNKCENPCYGVCGIGASCETVNHHPVCFCPGDLEGDPFISCSLRNPIVLPIQNMTGNPCDPSPCGPFSRCLASIYGHATCSCLPEYHGVPPVCQPECIVSSECEQTKSCISQKCQDPCPGSCGHGAFCVVINHNPICSCPPGQEGDPFVNCYEPIIEMGKNPITNPCVPSPCGPNSICQIKENRPICSCVENYIGEPPRCRPVCINNQECSQDKACIQEKCQNPCLNACGINAECHVVNHNPFCSCIRGYHGDAFIGCSEIPIGPPIEVDLCNPSPCGENAQCSIRNGIVRCNCIPPNIGNPYAGGCRPECTINSDCPSHLACLSKHCRDPCKGLCGVDAECTVTNHIPVCTCIQGFFGDPFKTCKRKPLPPIEDPCNPTPCGPNSICQVSNQHHASCSCLPNFIGSPPSCRPECVLSSECPQNKACIGQKCQDPCPGTCGFNARCQVINHNPICSCDSGMIGDPFVQCDERAEPPVSHVNPCIPSPCGANAECRVVDNHPVCSCESGMLGAPPNCRPECLIHEDCPSVLACVGKKCKDPCIGSCGFNAVCYVQSHQPMCSCMTGFEGDPFSGCNPIQVLEEPIRTPCSPSPCGANAVCKERNGAGACSCLPEYTGDPYNGCRPECVTNSDCDRSKACFNNKCTDPCLGACGLNAECRVINHAPSCYCLPGFTGNALHSCVIRDPVVEEVNPCQPSPCGPNSLCKVVNSHSVCTCQEGFIGTPPTCRPECIGSSECAQNKACIDQKCLDPCPGTCGINARCQVVNHNPICSCSPKFTGDPFKRCDELKEILPPPVGNPCVPSPCGPNSECRVFGTQAACSCLPDYIGRIPNCRPECTSDSECSSNMACINQKCTNPCPGNCGVNAICTIINHKVLCSCQEGYTGDATYQCDLIQMTIIRDPPSTPCSPSPCGPNAECREQNGAAACKCSTGYFGDPYDMHSGCQRECESNNDCNSKLICTRFKCVDPCLNVCGTFSECSVINHTPTCVCSPGYTGDPFFQCRLIPEAPPEPKIPENPCQLDPCGPNSQCRQLNGHAVCSCLQNYKGMPPNCRPECVVNAECDASKACIKQRCDDPCPNTCGLKAHCTTRNHNPICACPAGLTGDPFKQCYNEIVELPSTERPPSCSPSPCGPNSKCQLISGHPACSCLADYVGSPPNCRPECSLNSECPSAFACINQQCKDPCPGSCGAEANCHVLNHVAVCTCNDGYTGDPFVQCSRITETTPPPPRYNDDPCYLSPCGPNAECQNGECTCLPEYFGNPYESCRPECTGSQECSRNKACLRHKCVDPCPGTCGQNAICDVINHIPTCYCPQNYSGDPFVACRYIDLPPIEKKDPCSPSPCGLNSECRVLNDHATCSCLPGFFGTPPSCRPECVVSSECSQKQACVRQKCVDPCIGVCGYQARCEVINHSPICSCNPGQTGDPFKGCNAIIITPPTRDPIRACEPSPCGPNSICRDIGETPSCSCLDNYIGQPPNCRPECVINPDCPSMKACINNKCLDPCVGSCGLNAECRVISHSASCTCLPGFNGNAFIQCIPQKDPILNPCEPSPCGPNAVCHQKNGAGACTCIDEYQGNPYEGCRPECILNSDCPTNKACVRNKCQDPCPGVCGTNAECFVVNHLPSCNCLKEYTGDPFSGCKLIPPVVAEVIEPCIPNPCGLNSQCKAVNNIAVCSCLQDYEGVPPNCRSECIVNSECPSNKACHKFKCADPCRGTCGLGAKCQVINHNPICSCPFGQTGDPFSRCYPEPVEDEVKVIKDPCNPSPCGLYSICRNINDQASCSCLQNYIGAPPNCRPECIVNTDCPADKACISEHCRDPCPGSCGFNAECRVQNHIPTCFCPPGYTGNSFTQCSPFVDLPKPVISDPCESTLCGSNAQCNNGICTCLPEYFGDPYVSCRPECTTNSDCSPNKACFNNKCKDPCPGTCGQRAECNVYNHIPMCICTAGTTGDPFTYCKDIVNVIHVDKCNPSPCGPNSICKVFNDVAVCSCQPGQTGSPPNCRPECVVSSDCPLTLACLANKCKDPCPGTCGQNAHCQVINHNPICSCNRGNTGDPFLRCYPIETPRPAVILNPCEPSPCGPNSQCIAKNDYPACSCLQGYISAPPNCRPECTINSECSGNQACISQRCRDPCPGSCGVNAVCAVVNHNAVCSCNPGYTGDPFASCVTYQGPPPPPSIKDENPCYPSPCGPNARCQIENSYAVCECLPEYHGNPYEGCRPECLVSSDCPMSAACIGNKCKDPCPGTCGVGALCIVTNHIPICSCPPGTTGNAFQQCLIVPTIVTPDKAENPCVPSPCGPNTVCRVVNLNAVCECLPGMFGSPTGSGCRPECTISSDCPRDKACIRSKCADPCPGACGYKAQCQTINHSPICSCPAPYAGNPFVECKEQPADPCNPNPCGPNGQCREVNGVATCLYPECVINQDCPRDKACFSQKCSDPCNSACGFNALCQVVYHNPVCTCPPGYTGSPQIKCSITVTPVPEPECRTNNDCSNDKACIREQCQNPCTQNICGQNAACKVYSHRPLCTCHDGYTGNANVVCYEIGCRNDFECPPTQACINKECADPCQYTQCGLNALCNADPNHKARCYCPEYFKGDPFVRCQRPECLTDNECPFHLACRDERCRNPCNCAPNAECIVNNHQATCRCPSGFSGNPSVLCQKDIIYQPQCTTDADCASKLACFNEICKNPCLETNPCGKNAECIVVDTLPLRTMACLCPAGYVGDADVECKLAPQKIGCTSNSECQQTEACINRNCVNPCIVGNPCAQNAECQALNHKALCKCRSDLIGDPFINCYPVPQSLPECSSDSDCSSDKACFNSKCHDPCAAANPCGAFAECRTAQHRPLCYCPNGWAGNPQTQCYKPECNSDTDCPFDKACINENCLNPCLNKESKLCGRGAECIIQSHRAQCVCPSGTQGDPFTSCISVICQYNEDCADHEACDRLNRVCRPVCEQDTCANTASCIGRDHQAKCVCLPGLIGNPYVECTIQKDLTPKPECTIDADCPSTFACINAHCINPCTLPNVCSRGQQCRVLDSLPLRTVICECPIDTYIDHNGGCLPIIQSSTQCVDDSNCSDREKCIRGSCIDACRVDLCGINAQCSPSFHRGICSCAAGYTGIPHKECTNVPKNPTIIPQAECYKNDDCPFEKSCRNDLCIDPCRLDDACAKEAFCRVQKHQPVCKCPPGYNGDPATACIPPISIPLGCTSNSDCPLSESCINTRCIDPCNCGPNSECHVKNHYPICYCKPGYTGNPQIGCVKSGCQSDYECSSDKQCYNGECISPCLLDNPCSIRAECYGNNHRSACKCPDGFIGNPYDKCDRIECRTDNDCPNNRACSDYHCINPCAILNSPCAQNAICFVHNHAPNCRCPENLPNGNPMSFCEPSHLATEPECRVDYDCPSQQACIKNNCVNPCRELSPCASTARCTVHDSLPVRTMICSCPEGWTANEAGECKAITLPIPPGCTADDDCPSHESCINRICRNPCDCGLHSSCHVQNHRPICSCEEGFEGNPNIACRAVGCRIDSECDSGKACINGNCVNPCLVNDPCGINAECYVYDNKPTCKCLSGYRGDPRDRCYVIGCQSNSQCPSDRQCINSQCINPCIYEKPCSKQAECRVNNHLPICKCPVGMIGNPYIECRAEPTPECIEDGDCPSKLACLNEKCQNPCIVLTPCTRPSECEVVPSLPVRTMICICPSGYVSSGSGMCKPTPPIATIGGCITDDDCSTSTSCINSICRNPCNCGPNAECRIKNHKPVCSCKQGYDGNPDIECVQTGCQRDSDCSGLHTCVNRQCVIVCAADGSSCGTLAECYGINHRAICECPPGFMGNPNIACVLVGCRSDSECPSHRACINNKCEDPCSILHPCESPLECKVYNHIAACSCPAGMSGDVTTGCKVEYEPRCRVDADCPPDTACFSGECVNPCTETKPCGVNALCRVLNTLPVRTMICECLPGYQGNAAVQCDKTFLCRVDKGFIQDDFGNCICPPGSALNENGNCAPCSSEKGLKIDDRGHCVCDLERGMIIDERGNCVCPIEYGFRIDSKGNCIRENEPECRTDNDCPTHRYCNKETEMCEDPCNLKRCGVNTLCNATNHIAVCQCFAGYTGNPEIYCNHTSPFRTDFPRPDMGVGCLADGVNVEIHMTESGFNGVFYVKGHSKEARCRRVVTLPADSASRTETFKVHFGECGLVHVNGQASFILVIQKHPKLVTYKAQAYHIKCVYQTGEQNVTLGFNVSMLTTAGTIANTGPPPTCSMRIVTQSGQEINSAEIGDNLMLQVDVQPSTIYGGFARSCVAKTMEDNVENEYTVTDENGCATDPTIFGDWERSNDMQSLLASFNAFKFPSSDNIRFQCNIRVCFGKCQPVNCRGYDAFGRKKRAISEPANKTDLALPDSPLDGQLREEITIQSNAILTFEKRDPARISDPTEAPSTERNADICVSLVWLVVALALTALLALVAVAAAVSCWLLGWRRSRIPPAPLPHPPEFPNPLFVQPSPNSEYRTLTPDN